MVLQSYLQYRAFGRSRHLERFTRVHIAAGEKSSERGDGAEQTGRSSRAAKADANGARPQASRTDTGVSGALSMHTAPSTPMGDLSASRQQPEQHSPQVSQASTPHVADRNSMSSDSRPDSEAESAIAADLPGNTVGEQVQWGERDKATPVPAVPGKEPAPGKEHVDPFLVTWEPEDGRANPQNWTWTKKWCLVFFLVQLAALVGASASIDSAAAEQAAKRFGVSVEVMELQTGVFLCGFGLAAPFLGSLSEIGGRNPVYVLTLLPFILFEIGSAVAPNIQTRIITRFFAGFFGSTPLSNSGGSLADIVSSLDRTFVFPIFANAGFLGPALGPVIGGYAGDRLGQAWCDWLMVIWASALLVAIVLVMPETYAPVLLRMKAAHVRRATGDERYKTALEKEREKTPLKKHLKHVMALPFLYLIYEPIVLFTSLYMSMCYILLFGYFEAFPLIFEPFGLNVGQIGLTFLSVAVGLCATTAFTPLLYRRYVRLTNRARDKKREDGNPDWDKALPPPEERLVTAMIGTWCLPIGLFYQAWTSFPSLSPWPCICAGVVVGAGLLSVFISSYQYVIDVYLAGSATALGSLTFVRYLVSGGTVMFTRLMYLSLGNRWALSLLAFLSIPFCCIPWFFFFFGKRIRRSSRFAPPPDDE